MTLSLIEAKILDGRFFWICWNAGDAFAGSLMKAWTNSEVRLNLESFSETTSGLSRSILSTLAQFVQESAKNVGSANRLAINFFVSMQPRCTLPPTCREASHRNDPAFLSKPIDPDDYFDFTV